MLRANIRRSLRSWTAVVGACALATVVVIQAPSAAHACGGLFCNNAQPVNQAAERIIFSDNGDGTVTAIIEIQYDGPGDKFAWVLPVPGVPDVEVSSVAAFDRLQQATNPQYTLSRVFECQQGFGGTGAGVGAGMGALAGTGAAGVGGSGGGLAPPPVTVLATGGVGPYVYDVITVNPALDDRAEPALEWLSDNGYDVGDLGPEVLRPYLEQDLNLLAFKLDKTASSGSIRPIRLSYDGKQPFIPIRPTAVAAKDDMGIMVFVLSDARAIPREYKALELNEARINWFNPMSTYDDLVSEAANEAAGQGFVTELAGSTDMLEQVVVQSWERDMWRDFQNQTFTDPADMFAQAQATFGGWEGFEDALRVATMLPDDVTLQDFLDCPRCYEGREDVVLDDIELLTQIFERVVRPMFATQDLVDSRPYVTRLYTTMSADEMTMDPSFDFNDDLEDLSNFHTATQFIGCGSEWRVELASGDVVYGDGANVWPDTSNQPATRRIVQLTTSGTGEVVENNVDRIRELLEDGGEQPDPPVGGTSGGDGGSGGSSDGGSGGSSDGGSSGGDSTSLAGEGGSGGGNKNVGGSSSSSGSFDDADGAEMSSHANSCGCRVPGGTESHGGAPLLLLGLVAAVRRLRSRRIRA